MHQREKDTEIISDIKGDSERRSTSHLNSPMYLSYDKQDLDCL